MKITDLWYKSYPAAVVTYLMTVIYWYQYNRIGKFPNVRKPLHPWKKKKGKADILLCVKHFCHILIHGFSPSPLAGDFPGAGSETVTLKEGEDLNLRCTLSSDGSSARQWLNPHNFSIFLDTHRGKCENWRQHFPRGAGGSLRGGLSMARLTQLLPNRSRWFHTQPLSAGSWWNGNPPQEWSGTRAFTNKP